MPAPNPEAIWQSEGANKRLAVQRMFGEIAPTYDRINGLMSLNLHGKWRAAAVKKLALNPGDAALDVCCGTGDFLLPLRWAVGPSGRLVGLDFCLPMLDRAHRKLEDPALVLGDACRLPIQSASFDAVSVGWGMRNVPDLDAAHREIARALRPGGRFVSLDMARPRPRLLRTVSEWIFNRVVPWLGGVFGKTDAYTYLPKSTLRFADREQIRASMEGAGFKDVGYRDFMFGNVCLHWGQKG